MSRKDQHWLTPVKEHSEQQDHNRAEILHYYHQILIECKDSTERTEKQNVQKVQ